MSEILQPLYEPARTSWKARPDRIADRCRRLERDYYQRTPDVDDPDQLVSFGTSGHRGTPFDGTFTEAHILAITQAICEYRRGKGIDGPLFMGKDTHALSGPAQRTALEVLAANGVETVIQRDDGFTPTPVDLARHPRLTTAAARTISATASSSRRRTIRRRMAASSTIRPTAARPTPTSPSGVQDRANELLRGGNSDVKRVPYESALKAATTHEQISSCPTSKISANVIDMEAIRAAGLKLGVDPLGGASLPYWQPINGSLRPEYHRRQHRRSTRAFAFMTVDHDGKIRMDCSSPYAMARLVGLKDKFDVAFGNDPDSDRHGIVTPSAGLLNPNHYLAVAIRYLLTHRPQWPPTRRSAKRWSAAA